MPTGSAEYPLPSCSPIRRCAAVLTKSAKSQKMAAGPQGTLQPPPPKIINCEKIPGGRHCPGELQVQQIKQTRASKSTGPRFSQASKYSSHSGRRSLERIADRRRCVPMVDLDLLRLRIAVEKASAASPRERHRCTAPPCEYAVDDNADASPCCMCACRCVCAHQERSRQAAQQRRRRARATCHDGEADGGGRALCRALAHVTARRPVA